MAEDTHDPSLAADRVSQELRYRERETQFRTLVENIPGVVYRCACDEHWTMEFISDTIEELSGYPADEFLGNRVRSYASIIHPEDQAIVEQAVDEGVSKRTPYIIDYRVVDAAGQTHWVYEKGRGVFDDEALLWLDGVIFDVTDRRLAQERVRAEQKLLRQLLDLGERERKLLAYDIHDGFVQDVVGTKMMLEAMIASDDLEGPNVKDRLGRLVETLSHAVDEGRRLISELRPLIIDEQGILAAIEYLVGETQASPGAPAIVFQRDVRFERLPPLVESTIFRIVQEALNNIRRHSQATQVSIRLNELPGRILRIEITDDGVGFDSRNVPNDRFGLRSIVERTRLFHGTATIQSSAGQGTRILAEIPMDVPNG